MNRRPFSGGAKLRGFVAFALLAVMLTGCDNSSPTTQPQSNLRTITMQIGRQTFTLEVADTEPTRETGLMNRDSMPANHGMLFVFEDETPRAFWMKNTRIPLDILFIDAQGKVVSSKSMKPFDLRTTPSDAAAKYAIELNAGAAESSGVAVGDQLNIPLPAQPSPDKNAAASQPSPPPAK
jgi:uncharacterized membrane protein (UPF0127 family)